MKDFGFAYAAKLVRRGTVVLVRFPDFPEALTEGEGDAEALAQAADCLEEAIAGRIRRREGIPPASRPKPREHVIPVPAPMAAKAALYLALKEAGISKVELASRLRCHEREVRRLLDPRHPSKLPRIERALSELGKRLVVEMRAA